MLTHQDKQKEIIQKIDTQIESNSLKFSTVSPADDYTRDPRICLTSVHLPKKEFLTEIQQKVIQPLKQIEPNHFYYPPDSLHFTIKNIRVINDPPNFNGSVVQKAQKIFSQVIPKHKKFRIYYHRLLLFPLNLSVIFTTDPELDSLILELDQKLNEAGIPDDKKYLNNRYFFCNMTIFRTMNPPTEEFKEAVKELSDRFSFTPYTIDSVTLLSATAVFTKKQIFGNWKLK